MPLQEDLVVARHVYEPLREGTVLTHRMSQDTLTGSMNLRGTPDESADSGDSRCPSNWPDVHLRQHLPE